MKNIKKNIEESYTLPSIFYSSESIFNKAIDKLFVKSWQFITEDTTLSNLNSAYPFTLIDDILPEPLFLIRNNKGVECYSNVCTHRANLLIDKPCLLNHAIVCGYHGRRFDFSGKFLSMPETKGMKNFPCKKDDLPKIHCSQWNQFIFSSLDPSFSLDELFRDIEKRVNWMPIQDFVYREDLSKEYTIDANWALYCDNYLEGFHIPFVHEDLNKELDYGDYDTEIYDYFNVQVGYTNDSSIAFDFPKNHVDYGKKIAAYYFWVFPNMMFNFYPWGLSINIVEPISVNKTKVSFIPYVYDSNKLDSGAGSILDKVEKEDEFVVQNVQRGMRSKYYETGRFSPTREKGVHHFHLLISDFLNK